MSSEVHQNDAVAFSDNAAANDALSHTKVDCVNKTNKVLLLNE